jgi:hypothetical protein
VIDQYGVKLAFGQVARLYYGNDAGMKNNRVALKELGRIRSSVKGEAQADVGDPKAKFLRENGYVLLRGAYDRGLVDRIRAQYVALLDDANHSAFNGPRIKEASRAVIDPAHLIPEIRELLTPEVCRCLRGYYGAHFGVKSVRAWRILPVPNVSAAQDVYSNLWHSDPFPVTGLRLFVLLSDGVTRETGATCLHPVASTKAIMRSGYFRRRLIVGKAKRLINDPSRTVYFEGGLGDACICNVQTCLHKAGVPKPGTSRDIIQFHIVPSDKPLSDNWAEELPHDTDAV